MNKLRNGLFAVLSFVAINTAQANACSPADEGVYVNPELDENARIEVRRGNDNTITFEVNIPCRTKASFTTLTASCPTENDGRYMNFEIQEGGSQCYLGPKPRISIHGDNLTIRTGIRTPGFDGNYEFVRQP